MNLFLAKNRLPVRRIPVFTTFARTRKDAPERTETRLCITKKEDKSHIISIH